MKTAMITGAGQDSSYLTEMLLDRGYKVVTVVRRASYPNTKRLDHLKMLEESDDDKFTMDYFDLCDATSINKIIIKYKPDVIFNMAAQSHVGISFDNAVSTMQFNAIGPLLFLEAIRQINPKIKFYQASSSEMFGISPPPQKEDTPFMPCSPYGVAKLAAYHLVRTYRNGYGIHASNGILFNHESERRGLNFVTRKITLNIAEIVAGKREKITLGNLDAKRDWGHSKDYMRAIIEIMESDKPMDVVISTGETYSIKEFLEEAFNLIGLNWKDYVVINDKFKRPFDVPALLGDNSKAMKTLKWRPEIKFQQLVKEMLENDLQEVWGHGIEEAKDFMKKGKEVADKVDNKIMEEIKSE